MILPTRLTKRPAQGKCRSPTRADKHSPPGGPKPKNSPGLSILLSGPYTSYILWQARPPGFHPAVRASVEFIQESPKPGSKTVEIHLVDPTALTGNSTSPVLVVQARKAQVSILRSEPPPSSHKISKPEGENGSSGRFNDPDSELNLPVLAVQASEGQVSISRFEPPPSSLAKGKFYSLKQRKLEL
ncbi:hypothetical protein O6P43_031882 [Quillaja saponaria]|uniref:Uncharacterized protein n=1 Tax=Quillaja saponaria TaxID=32244 RepID=A0AAD7KWB6_QUISA|nr:hypothetical protein O6P43_031882 [Quillaja saponaria]